MHSVTQLVNTLPYTLVTCTRTMDQLPPYILRAATFTSTVCLSVFLSNDSAIPFTRMFFVINVLWASAFGLLSQRRLEASTEVGRNGEALNAVIANFHGTPSCDFGISTCMAV